MTATELYDMRNKIEKAGVLFIAISKQIPEPRVHISLDTEEGGEVLYNPHSCPVSSWIERVYCAMIALGLIN